MKRYGLGLVGFLLPYAALTQASVSPVRLAAAATPASTLPPAAVALPPSPAAPSASGTAAQPGASAQAPTTPAHGPAAAPLAPSARGASTLAAQPSGSPASSGQSSRSAEPTLHATFQTYAAGMHVADVDSAFNLSPFAYQMALGYHTTGVVGFFFRGHQSDSVSGTWRGERAAPYRFVGLGEWHGVQRVAEIDYPQGNPAVRQLVPPNADEREPIPDALQANTIDTLSALAELIHVVRDTGRCETTARTYDGRRVLEIEAHTVGEDVLEPTDRSSFAGKALRCDFSGRMLAGFKFGDDRVHDSKPMHGSAWLALVMPGASPLPVRMSFETRWVGDAVMYITEVGRAPDLRVAQGN